MNICGKYHFGKPYFFDSTPPEPVTTGFPKEQLKAHSYLGTVFCLCLLGLT